MNIYVGNLPFRYSDNDLRELFSAYGQVKSAKIIMDRETDRSRGFGFVEMMDAASAETAIKELNEADVDGRSLVVNEARERGPSRR
ncbi:MAG: RNA-binding protein [Phycisphaerales bacterium]|nr:RNA-binding protein [Phycisphaerales bacterium]